MAKGKFKCSRCDRTFSMAAHLARHKNTIHASKAKKKAAKKKARGKKKARKRRIVKRARRTGKRVGRPRGIASRLGLQGLTLEQLGQLITAARSEARRKMAEVAKSLR